jgi:hypothetical protein
MKNNEIYKDKFPELRHFFICYFSEDAGYIDGQRRLNYEEIFEKEVMKEYADKNKRNILVQEIDRLLNEHLDIEILKRVIVEGFHGSDISNMEKFLKTQLSEDVLKDIKKRMTGL